MSINDKLNELLNDVDIMSELENEHFITPLNEMSQEKTKIEQYLMSKVTIINDHLLKCLLLQDSTNSLNHWIKEIWGFLPELPLIKGTNKLPSEKMIRNHTISYFDDTLLDHLDIKIKGINYEENSNVTSYNKQSLYDCIIEYYNRLIPVLARNGEVDDIFTTTIINELIQKYNESK